MTGATLHDLETQPWERVNPSFQRKLVSGERTMMAHLRLDAGCEVARHSHHHEQLSYVIEGRLRFLVDDGGTEVAIEVGPGQVLHLPGHLPHSAVALEDTVGIDLFSPPREDWIDGSDAYLRR